MIYLRVDSMGILRKAALDMAFLLTHKKIRLPKIYFEEGLYFLYQTVKNESLTEKYYLTIDKIIKEDKVYYYFDFPFKSEQVI